MVITEKILRPNEIPQKVQLRESDILNLKHGNFEVLNYLGEGGFGSVYEISDELGLGPLAIKVLDLWRMKKSEYEELTARFEEGFKAGQIESQFLVKHYRNGAIEGNPYMIMEYCQNGNLANKKKEFYNENKADQLASGILKGLMDLHVNGVVHRDLKPENILFDKINDPKLTDFDIAGRFSGNVVKRMTKANLFGHAKEVWGTILYAAPEQLDHSKAYKLNGPQLDTFAFGVTMYEILSGGKLPFGDYADYEKDPKSYLKKKSSRDYKPIKKYRPNISKKWVDILDACFEPNHKKRIGDLSHLLSQLENTNRDHYSNDINRQVSGIFRVTSGEGVGEEFNLKQISKKMNSRVLTMGWKDKNNNTNNIPLSEEFTAYISKNHATIEIGKELFFIKDGQWIEEEDRAYWKHSTNGVFINSKPLEKDNRYPLKFGDIITIGSTNIKVE